MSELRLNDLLASVQIEIEHSTEPVTIAVVDAAGSALLLLRGDGAPAFSVDVALAKARTAAAFGNDTEMLEELWSQRPIFAHSLIVQGSWFVGRGGVPILDATGIVLGGVGVSGNEPGAESALARRLSEALQP